MFTFDGTPIKFVGLLLLFAWCSIWSVYEVTRPQDGRQRISNGLHLVMSVVMVAMVSAATWRPLEGLIPLPVWLTLFIGSVGWFVVLAVRSRMDRHLTRHYVGHAVMFAAMAWHLGGMAVLMAAPTSGHVHGPGGHSMPGMNHAAPSSSPTIVALIGLPLMGYLLYAAATALRQAFRPAIIHHGHAALGMAGCHERRVVGTPAYRGAALAGFAMNFGMFWMSTGLLAAILPFLRSI